ncbi:MAG: porin family protein [Methylobacteriaceae bacterium]|nr:porin family protein [Methylobacteriaceae bacterium]
MPLPSRKAPPPVAYVALPPVFTWTGFYVGLNGGAAIGNSRYDWQPFGNSFNQGGVAFTGGGQIGYNWQTGPLVLGLETDINYRTARRTIPTAACSARPIGSGYFGTVRGRLGFAMDRDAVLRHGRPAYGNARFPATMRRHRASAWRDLRCRDRQSWHAPRLDLGAGVEYAFTRNWSVKAEYLYVDLGRNSANYVDLFTGAPVALQARQFAILFAQV